MFTPRVFILAFFFIAIITSCISTSKLYQRESFAVGQLTKTQFDSLKNYLQSFNSFVKDTIVIKYDFNNESCWNFLDQQSNEYIEKVIDSKLIYITRHRQTRPEISVFHFKEKGNRFNKLIKMDTTVQVDQGLLKNLIFSEPTVCGTSAIILPTGKYLLTKSDSHFESLQFTSDKIKTILEVTPR